MALDYALYSFVHDNIWEMMRDPAGWAARAADKAAAAADTIGGTGASDGSGTPLGWNLNAGSGSSSGDTVNLTGHSLGGHLALAAQGFVRVGESGEYRLA